MKCNFFKTKSIIFASVLGASIAAKADLTVTFQWSGSLWESGFTGQNIQSDDAIGIYAFTTSSTGNTASIANPLYSVCLSPAGLLDGNPHTYDELTFAAANPGIFPSAWAWNGNTSSPQYWGIQNAAYLWSTFGMNIVNGSVGGLGLSGNSSEQAAALEFAIWNSLYNSTGYGALGGNVYTPAALDAAEAADFSAYNASLTSGQPIQLYTGDILEGTGAPGDGANGGDDQELFLLMTPPPSPNQVVPEPTTLISGALLVLPFGGTAFRALRKKLVS